MTANWVRAAGDEELSTGRRVVRLGEKQILLIVVAGRVFACNNRCPHEGYPLSEGTLAASGGAEEASGEGCTLTCNWHNWKFDLSTGTTLVGGDPVRVYPTERRGREVWVDVADPPPAARIARALDGVAAAVVDDDYARIARETARLAKAGGDPVDALRATIAGRAEHLEFGLTHAFAAAPDWLLLHDRAPDAARRLVALVEPIEHIAWDTLREASFPYPAGRMTWNADGFAQAIEREDEAAAIAHVRGALAEGIGFAVMRPAFARAALAHYADFGHAAIYAYKAGQLIGRLGPGVAEPVLLALTRSLVYASREDLIPEFRFYAEARRRWDGAGNAPVSARDFVGLPVTQALRRVLKSSADIPALYDALTGAAAWSMLRFDIGVDRQSDKPVSHNVSWLDFTHMLTFANAARNLCIESPTLWPDALLQLACFVGRNASFVDAALDVAEWSVDDPAGFIDRELAALYDHGQVEPIVAAHLVKVLFALEEERAAAPGRPWLPEMAAAVHRFLRTPLKRRHALRHARQSIAFVAAEG
jgi:nitrite reductase/ring-hydroxylating ferredoxin subunit